MAVGTWKVTWKGLRRAASNVFWFPFRAVMFVFLWFLRLVFGAAAVGLVATIALGAYFYFAKSNQPMVIDPRFAHSLPPEGMTFREFWQDRFAGWARIDERDYRTGKSKAKAHCVPTQRELFPLDQVFIPFLRVFVVRTQPGTPEAESWIRGAKGKIAPAELSFVDAVWWQIENESWWYWVDHQAICKLPPPKRPAAVTP